MPVNEHGQPIGEPLTKPLPTEPPSPSPMTGDYCELQHLEVADHLDDLWAEFSSATDGADWTYLPDDSFESIKSLRTWMERAEPSTDPLFFAIVERSSNRAVGFASFLRIAPMMGSIEVGYIHFGRSLQKTPAATEAMFLMMQRAFELGYRRFEWKCDALNAPSRRAAERLGFTYEGTFRQATAYKGRNRDTAWFSIIDAEWPAVRVEFERWLDASNFDGDGNQRTRLDMARTL